tara:strand:+ start:112 stop:420 length:309 start_codon:yes stop_codon:yes gene_type:complete
LYLLVTSIKFTATITTKALWFGAYADKSQELHSLIEEMRAEGLGYRRIAKRLNALGITSPRGCTWLPPSVYSILKKRRLRDGRLNAPPEITVSDWTLEYLEI